MSKRSKQRQFGKSELFNSINPEYEDEILEAYGSFTIENPDLNLVKLPELFSVLQIPSCFCQDINLCIDYYYEHMQDIEQFDSTNHKQYITMQLIKNVTISSNIDDVSTILDIVDIDKLIKITDKLLKFRDFYQTIYESWKLFINASRLDSELNEQSILSYKLTLPDLKNIKTSLNLDHESNGKYSLGDSFLIDMLGCCSTDPNGNMSNYDFYKIKSGSSVTIKDFAEILGNLGEFD